MGRPPLGPAKRRRLEVTLSPEERAILEAAAEAAGLSLAAYIRKAALAHLWCGFQPHDPL